MSRLWTLLVISLGLVATTGRTSHAGGFFGYVDWPDSSTIAFHFGYWEDPNNPAGHPEWVGFDVLRRSVADCGPFVRVNDQPYPREPGQSYNYTYTESPPERRTTYMYRVIAVDANRQQLSVPCEWPCLGYTWASSPRFSAPATQGTLSDWGWALFITPTASTCYGSFYFEGYWAEELRPLVGTGTVVNLYGSPACGTIEGCAIGVDHYDIVDRPVPVRAATWGRLKAIYR
jgi:hypothetical protein